MTITIETKEIAELLEPLAQKSLANKEDISKLGECFNAQAEHTDNIVKFIDQWFRVLNEKLNVISNTTS